MNDYDFKRLIVIAILILLLIYIITPGSSTGGDKKVYSGFPIAVSIGTGGASISQGDNKTEPLICPHCGAEIR